MLPDITRNRHRGNEQSIAANAVAHPHKLNTQQRILAMFGPDTELTIYDIAARLDKSVNAFSGRITALKASGDLVEAGTRPGPNRAACTVYRRARRPAFDSRGQGLIFGGSACGS